MATQTIPWTVHATYIIVGLLAIGAISYENVPTYFCSPENTIQRCAFLDSTNLTCYVPFKDINGNWTITGDRCQKSRTYGKWTKVEKYIELPVTFDPENMPAVEVNKPTIFLNSVIYKDINGDTFVRGMCYSRLEVD